MERLLKLAQTYVIYATIFLLPVAFANISPNPYIVVKLVVLVCGVSLALILWCIRTFISGKLEFHKGAFDIPVLILAGSYLLSTILKTPNKMEAVLLPGTATALVGSAILYFLINQYEQKRGFVLTLLISGAFFSFVTLLSAFGALEAIPQLPQFVKAAGFTPEGGFLPAAIFLVTLLVVSIGSIILDKNIQTRVIGGICATLITFGLIASVINIIPGSKFAPRFPGLSTSWSIAVDTIKDSPILGVGPGNYLTAFSRFRPLSYNESDLWAVKFATATNFLVTAFTETGLLGISGILLIVFVIYRKLRKDSLFTEGKITSLETLYVASLVVLLILLAIFPATLLVTFLLFVLLGFASGSRRTILNLRTENADHDSSVVSGTKIPALLITLPVLVAVLFVLYSGAKIVRAEYTFTQGITALNKNDAQKTYQYLTSSIQQNPRVDRYRMTTAQVSLLLANAVAQKKDLSDSDKQTITTLVQTAIEQAKAAVALNPLRSTNWEVLAGVYRTVMPLAKGADKFAIQAASQAIALDPYNPNLRVGLGGIYYALGDYDNAIKVFESAVAAKNNLANAYYNLAFAYREKGDLAKAEGAMSQVLSLVDKSSKDYEVAKKALEDIQAKKKESEAAKGEELIAPKKDEPILDPKLNLPEGSEPPVTAIPEQTITPSPVSSGTVTPQITPTTTPTE